jgi:hypothetical protein
MRWPGIGYLAPLLFSSPSRTLIEIYFGFS